MRIMIVHSYYFPEIYGGAEYSVKKLAETLQRRGHTIRVLCSGEKDVLECIDGVEVQRVRLRTLYRTNDVGRVPRWIRLMGHFISIWNYGNTRIIDRAIKTFFPDVIHTNCLYGFSPIVWKIAKKNSVHVVHTLRDYHLMCPLVALSCKYTKNEYCSSPKLSCRYHRNQNRIHSAYVDCVTAPSKCTLDILLNNGFFKFSEKAVIPNAIDYDYIQVENVMNHRINSYLDKDKTVFVYLGALTEQKGIRWMIEAFRRIPINKNVELKVAGKGVLEEYVQTEASKDSRIKFLGFLNEKQVEALLMDSDVLLCPSLWDEPFGRVVLDAYKSGMPVISSDCGALPELVKNHETGIVVKAGDIQALYTSLMQLVINHKLISKYGQYAILELEKYSLDRQAEGFEKTYTGRR